jgi:hypothetical protein
MVDEIIAIYALADDLLKAVGHTEDSRTKMSDAEIITSGLVAARFFGSNQEQACEYLQEWNLSSYQVKPMILAV